MAYQLCFCAPRVGKSYVTLLSNGFVQDVYSNSDTYTWWASLPTTWKLLDREGSGLPGGAYIKFDSASNPSYCYFRFASSSESDYITFAIRGDAAGRSLPMGSDYYYNCDSSSLSGYSPNDTYTVDNQTYSKVLWPTVIHFSFITGPQTSSYAIRELSYTNTSNETETYSYSDSCTFWNKSADNRCYSTTDSLYVYNLVNNGGASGLTLGGDNWTESSFDSISSNTGVSSYIPDGVYLFVVKCGPWHIYNSSTDTYISGDSYYRLCFKLEIENGIVFLTTYEPRIGADKAGTSDLYFGAHSGPMGFKYDYYKASDWVVDNARIELGTSTLDRIDWGSSLSGYLSYDKIAVPSSTPTPTKTQLYVSGTTATKTYDGTANSDSNTNTSIICGTVTDGSENTVNVSLVAVPNTGINNGHFRNSANTEDQINATSSGGCKLPVCYEFEHPSDASNYELPAAELVSATINKKNLVLSNVYAEDKDYDGGTLAEILWDSVDTIYNNEVEVHATGTFASKNQGSRSVTITYSVVDKVSGSGASSNYNTPTSPSSTTATIGKAELLITLPTVVFNGKPYDGTTLSPATVNGISLANNTLTSITGFSGFSGFVGTEGAVLKATAVYDPTLAAAQDTYEVTVTFSLTANSGTSLSNYIVSYSSQNPVIKTAVISAPLQAPTVIGFGDMTNNSNITSYAGDDAFRVICYSPDGIPKIRWDGTEKTMTSLGGNYYKRNFGTSPRENGDYTLAHKCEVFLAEDTDISSCCYFVNLLDNGLAGSSFNSTEYDGTAHARMTLPNKVYVEGTSADTLSNIGSVFECDTTSFSWITSASNGTMTNVGSYRVIEGRNAKVTHSGVVYDAFLYADGTVSGVGAASITPRTITPTITSITKEYNGSGTINNSTLTSPTTSVSTGHIQFQIGSSDIVSGEDVVITASVSGGFGSSEAGTYSRSVTFGLDGLNASNYQISPVTYNNAQITPKALTITGTSPTVKATKTYDGTAGSGSNTDTVVQILGTVSGKIGSDDVSVVVSPNGNFSRTNAGTGTLPVVYSLSGSAANNYTAPASGNVSATINKREIGVNGTTVTKVYDGATTAGTATIGTTLTNALSGNDVSSLQLYVASVGTYSGSDVASNYAVDVTYSSSNSTVRNNYTILPSTNVSAAITTKGLSISGTTIADKDYDGTTSAQVNLGTVTGIVSGDDVTVIPSAQFSAATPGTYTDMTVTYSLDGAKKNNYTAPANTTGLSATINTVSLTITCGLSPGNGGSFDETKPQYMGHYSNMTYTKDYDGYGLTLWAYVEDTRIYTNGANSSYPYEVYWSVDGGTTYGSQYSSRSIPKAAATIPVKCKVIALNTNTTYYSNVYTIQTKKKQLGFEQNAGSSVQTKTYDNSLTAQINIGTVEGIAEGENVIVNATGNFLTKNAGTDKDVYVTYDLTGTASSVKANYLPPESETLQGTILPKTIKITSLGAYTGKTYDGNTVAAVPAYTDVSTSVYDNEVAVYNTSSFSNSDVGENKTVTVTFEIREENHSGAAGNYVLDTTTNNIPSTLTATITPKTLSVTGNSVQLTKTYDGTDTAQVLALGSLNSAEIIASDRGDTKVRLDSAVATYADYEAGQNITITEVFTLAGTRAANYQISNKTFTGSIDKKKLTVSGTTIANRAYNGTTTATISKGTLNGVLEDDIVGWSASGSFPSANAGTYDVVVSYTVAPSADGANYEAPDPVTVSATINKVSLYVPSPTLSFTGKDYDGEVLSQAVITTGTITGFITGEGGTVVATPTYNPAVLGANVGTYGVSVSYELEFNDGTLANNYSYSITTNSANTSATAVISPRPITISNISSTNN